MIKRVFNWENDKNFSSKIKEGFLIYPLAKYRELLFVPKLMIVYSPGEYEKKIK